MRQRSTKFAPAKAAKKAKHTADGVLGTENGAFWNGCQINIFKGRYQTNFEKIDSLLEINVRWKCLQKHEFSQL